MNQREIVTLSFDFPVIAFYLNSVKNIVALERGLRWVASGQVYRLKPHQQQNLFKTIADNMSLSGNSHVTAPLSKIFLTSIKHQEDIVIPEVERITIYRQALNCVKTMMPTPKDDRKEAEQPEQINQPRTNPYFQKKYADKSLYEQEHSALSRNCTKRRTNALHGLKIVYQQVKQVMVVQLIVESKQPFGCTSAKSPHFINRFLALRLKARYKCYPFLGLVGYVKKLIMVNSQQAIGGFVTLIFERSIKTEYHQYAMSLITLLTDLAKEDNLDISVAYSSLFDDRKANPLHQKKTNQFRVLQHLITAYTHMDYYQAFCEIMNPIEPDTTLIKLRSFEVSFPKV